MSVAARFPNRFMTYEHTRVPPALRSLVRMLAHTLDPAFKVEEEVSVGKVPLRVDILLIRREGGQLSEVMARDLAESLPMLNRFTLIEFKGPTDTMERGDFARPSESGCVKMKMLSRHRTPSLSVFNNCRRAARSASMLPSNSYFVVDFGVIFTSFSQMAAAARGSRAERVLSNS